MWGRHQRSEAWREEDWNVRHHRCIHDSQVWYPEGRWVKGIGCLERRLWWWTPRHLGSQTPVWGPGSLPGSQVVPAVVFVYRRVAPPNLGIIPHTRPEVPQASLVMWTLD